MYLLLMQADKNRGSRHRALVGLDRITLNNSLELSKKWTDGEEIRGFDVMAKGMPLSLTTLKDTLKNLRKTEKNKENMKLIKRLQKRLRTI